MAEIEIWVLVDQDGDYAVGTDTDSAATAYAAEYTEDMAVSRRLVKITLKVPLPRPVELTGEVPAEPEGASLRVA